MKKFNLNNLIIKYIDIYFYNIFNIFVNLILLYISFFIALFL